MAETARLEAVLFVAKACAIMRAAGVKRWPTVLREAIFFFWETRELGKFDANRRHSAAARALSNDRNKRYDHALPLRLLLPDVLICQTVDELRMVLSRIQVVIITAEEDQALTRAGLRQRMPEVWDGSSVFDRYAVTGIALEELPEA